MRWTISRQARRAAARRISFDAQSSGRSPWFICPVKFEFGDVIARIAVSFDTFMQVRRTSGPPKIVRTHGGAFEDVPSSVHNLALGRGVLVPRHIRFRFRQITANEDREGHRLEWLRYDRLSAERHEAGDIVGERPRRHK